MNKDRRILIVDDDELLRKGTARIMASAGYQTVTARNGAEGLAALDDHAFDLVLLDVDLPDINGREICKRIRRDPRFKGVYVVMLSSTKIAPDDKVTGLEGGADGYIGRPVANRELLARVNAMLRLKSTEETLRINEARKLEARKSETIANMAGGIAHDFNNLLTVIIGNIQLAQEDCEPPHPAAEKLDAAAEACLWATAITHKFLTLSQSINPVLDQGNLAELIAAVIDDISMPHGIQVQKDISKDLPTVRFDRDQLHQALTCLMTNAVDAMPNGGTLTIRLNRIDANPEGTGLEREPQAVISIEDTGKGIPQNLLPKIFDPYFSTKEMGSQKGMGLGLATANAIIVQHKGNLELHTEIDKGTQVTVFLPLTISQVRCP